MISKTVWLDISELKNWSGAFTGIQRMVFSIAKELMGFHDLNVRLCRYDRKRHIFVETTYDFVEYSKTESAGKIINTAHSHGLNSIKKVIPSSIKRHIKSVLNYTSPPYISTQPEIDISEGDSLYILGAFWTGQIEAIERLKLNNSIQVVSTLYDMIPVIMPEMCAVVTEIDFSRYLNRAIDVTDLWICISENTRNDLIEYAKANNLSLNADKCVVINPGSDINTAGKSSRPLELNEDEPFLLFVSTIEPRKNHQLIYQAIKLARSRGIEIPKIVFAGKHGWMSDDFLSIISRDNSVDNRLVWLSDVDDSNLRWLYQNTAFTLYPCIYEGWGLPVAESLLYGKFCIASRASSIPEIAGELIDYISPYDASELLDKISFYINNPEKLKIRTSNLKRFKAPSWSEAALLVKQALIG